MLKPIAAFVVASTALMPGAFAAAVPTTWDFYETSLTLENGQTLSDPQSTPAVIRLPASGSVTYSFGCQGATPTTTGDSSGDWSFVAGSDVNLALPKAAQGCFGTVYVSFSVANDVLSGTVLVQNTDYLSMTIMNDVVTSATIGTDIGAFGIDDGEATFSGYWQDPSAVPEPMPIALFGVGAIGLIVSRWGRRRNHDGGLSGVAG